MNEMLGSRLLSKGTKKEPYTSFVRPIVMYACETWSTIQVDENGKLLKGKYYGKFTDLHDFKVANTREETMKTWKCYLASRVLDYFRKRNGWSGLVMFGELPKVLLETF